MQNLCQDFCALDNPWSWAVEIGVAIHHIHSIRLHSRKRAPLRTRSQRWQVSLSLGNFEATWHDDDHLGLILDQRLPSDLRAMRASSSKGILPAGDLD